MRSKCLVAMMGLVSWWSASGQEMSRDCAVLDRYMTAATNGFQSIRGARDEFGDYSAREFLPRANRCTIDLDFEGKYRAVCIYLFIDLQDRAAGLEEMRHSIAKCLSWRPEDVQSARPRSYKGVGGYRISIRPFKKFDARVEIAYDSGAR